jgi:hypothetical protein
LRNEFVGEEAAVGQMTTLWPEPQSQEARPTREYSAVGGYEDAEEWPQTREDVGQRVAA